MEFAGSAPLSGLRLGRLKSDPELLAEDMRQLLDDQR